MNEQRILGVLGYLPDRIQKLLAVLISKERPGVLVFVVTGYEQSFTETFGEEQDLKFVPGCGFRGKYKEGNVAGDELCVSRAAIKPGDRVLVIDDLVATGVSVLPGNVS